MFCTSFNTQIVILLNKIVDFEDQKTDQKTEFRNFGISEQRYTTCQHLPRFLKNYKYYVQPKQKAIRGDVMFVISKKNVYKMNLIHKHCDVS